MPGDLRPGVVGLAEEFVVIKALVLVAGVAGELHRRLVEGPGAGVAGDRRREGLEVEVVDWEDGEGELTGEGGGHHRGVVADRPHLALLDLLQGEVGGDPVDGGDAGGREPVALLLPAPVELADVVRDRLRPATGRKGAHVGLGAVGPDGDLRQVVFLQHLCHLFRQRCDIGEEPVDLRGAVAPGEEVGEVGEEAGAVQVHQLHPGDVDTGGLDDEPLHRHVGDVLLLHLRRRLDLDDPPGVSLRVLHDVDPDMDAFALEGRLVNRRSSRRHRRRRVGHRLLLLPRHGVDQHAAGKVRRSQLADPVANSEYVALRWPGDKLRRLLIVHRPVEELVALHCRPVQNFVLVR